MGRKRYINSDISTDPKVADLAAFGPLPILLYTWAILHADDWGRMTGDPRQFKLLVCPALDVTANDIELTLNQIASVGLWERYEIDGRFYIAFPEESWFKYQSYISREKRNAENGRKGSTFPAPNSAKQHHVAPNDTDDSQRAPNAAESHLAVIGLPSPSPSPSPTPSLSSTERENAHAREEDGVDREEEIDESLMTDVEVAVSRLTRFHLKQNLKPPMTDLVKDRIVAMCTEYPPPWILEAIEEAKLRGAKSLGYLDTVLIGWSKDGKSSKERREEERANGQRQRDHTKPTRTNPEPKGEFAGLRSGTWTPPADTG